MRSKLYGQLHGNYMLKINDMKKTIRFALMAVLTVGLSFAVTSCKDDDNDNGNGTEQQGSDSTEGTMTLADDQLSSLIYQWCDVQSGDLSSSSLRQKTYDVTEGVVLDESRPTVRSVEVGTIEGADAYAARALHALGIDNQNPAGFSFSDAEVGTVSYKHGGTDANVLATVDVDVKQLPGLTRMQLVKQLPENAGGAPYYELGKGMKIYYEISLQDIVTKEELEEEQNNFMAEMKERQQNEPEAIETYVRENNITVKPNDKGVYVIVKKKGTGAKVAAGRTVAMNYTGRLLDGTMFDSSVESDAIQGGLQQPGRTYEPLTYVVGQMRLIPGWEESVMGMPEGTVMQVIMPSAQGYGPQGAGQMIPPYSPLVFDIEIVSVK